MRIERELSSLLLVAVLCAAQGCTEEDDQARRYAISGTITGATGVTVSLTGTAAASTVTDGSGKYSFPALAAGSYTVTPSKAGYAFSPGDRTVTIDGADLTGQDFTTSWALDGTTWTYCRVEDDFPQDELETFTFFGGKLYRSQLEYESTDSSCSGAAHGDVANALEWTITVGGEVDATLEGTTVVARAIDAVGAESFDGVLYVDAEQDPQVLYIGPGSTELWPRPYVRDELSGATAPALQGTWISCNTEETDFGEVFTIDGYAISVTGTSYTSGDGSCTGTPTPSFEDSALYVLRGTVSATLGDTTVTARESDAVLGSRGPLYTILFIDTSVTPNVLYTGDELADPARDGSAPDKRPLVLHESKPRVKQP